MTGELVAATVLGAGVYLIVTALPFAEPRQSLDERLRRFDVDARLAERRSPRWASGHFCPGLLWTPWYARSSRISRDHSDVLSEGRAPTAKNSSGGFGWC